MVRFKEFLDAFKCLRSGARRAALRNEVMIVSFLNSPPYELQSNVSLAWRR